MKLIIEKRIAELEEIFEDASKVLAIQRDSIKRANDEVKASEMRNVAIESRIIELKELIATKA